MAKNLGRKYATMSEDERRRFELEEGEGTNDRPAELNFDEPRDEDRATQGKEGEPREATKSRIDDV